MLVEIPFSKLLLRPFHIFDEQWALLVGGCHQPNPMTVSWGGLGTIWGRPVVTLYVRRSRHTWSLLQEHPEFTVNFLPESFRPAMDICGALSGRSSDKWREAGLKTEPALRVATPRVAGAELVFECRLLWTMAMDPAGFANPSMLNLYPNQDFHDLFIAEALGSWVDERIAPRFTETGA